MKFLVPSSEFRVKRKKPRIHMRGSGRVARGFTLLELVLVMILICTALAVSAPDLRGFSAGARMRNAAQEVLALTGYARSQAASEGRVYRLNVENGEYYVSAQSEGEFTETGVEMGRRFRVAEGVRIELVRGDGVQGTYVNFYPDGRTEPGRIRLISETSELDVVCEVASERFRVVSGGTR